MIQPFLSLPQLKMADKTSPNDQVCSLCMDQISNLKSLPCLHSFCEKCLEPLVLTQDDGTGILGCPVCRFPVTVPVEGIKGLPATTTSSSGTNTSAPQHHNLSTCQNHKQVMKLYCETCEEIVCNMCAIEDHHDHHYYLMTTKFNQLLQRVQEEMDPVTAKLRALRENTDEIAKRQREIETRGNNLMEEVQSLAERLILNIKASEETLLSQLKSGIECKINLLEQQKKMANSIISQVEECHEEMQRQLSLKTPHVLYKQKKKMMEDIESVKSINESMYEAAELCDTRFNGNGTLVFHCKELGNITSSFIHQQCIPVILPGRKKIQAGINTSFEFSAAYPDKTPVSLPPSLFTCTLTTPTSDDPIMYPVTTTRRGTYQVNYTPLTSGTYQVTLKVADKELTNSPFQVIVTPTAGIGGKSVQIIPKLQFPWGVALNNDEELIAITETGQHCIGLFNKHGQRVGTIGSKGKEDGCFTNPRGIAIMESGHIIVSDYERIQKLNASGNCIRSLCGHGTGPLQFADPKGIAVHKLTGKILVSDSNNHRIQVLNGDLTFSHSFGKQGKEDGEFQFPWDVACDREGNVFVVDNENHAVQKFTLEGKFLLKFGGKGEEPGKLQWPSGIAIDHNNMVYVTDDNQAISVFENNGTFVNRIKEDKHGNTGFKHPIGIMVDSNGYAYVSDCWNSRVIILSELN